MRGFVLGVVGLMSIAACAGTPVQAPAKKAAPPVEHLSVESPLPATIGVAVASRGTDVVVVAVRADGPAARARLEPGDRILRLDGVPVTDATDFERRVLDAMPGSVVRIEFTRGAQTRVVELPVEEVLLAVRA